MNHTARILLLEDDQELRQTLVDVLELEGYFVVAVDRGDFAEYQRITRGLEASLISLSRGGRLGEMFSKHTTNPMRLDRLTVILTAPLS